MELFITFLASWQGGGWAGALHFAQADHPRAALHGRCLRAYRFILDLGQDALEISFDARFDAEDLDGVAGPHLFKVVADLQQREWDDAGPQIKGYNGFADATRHQ
jgi:hypothetical protein